MSDAAAKAPRRSPRATFVDDYLLYLLARASHQASRQFHKTVRAHGLRVPEWRVLACLCDGPATIGDLAEKTLIQQPTLTKIVDRMADTGLLSRRPHAHDGRKVLVAITKTGRGKAEALIAEARRHEDHVLDRYEPGEADALKRALHDLIARTTGDG